jgi:secondary thiamine-phosphate synthase enzyme
MRQQTHELIVKTPTKGLVEISEAIGDWTAQQAIATGLLTVFCRHTSASLLIQENAASAVRADLEAFFETLAPEDPRRYRHNDEGPDDMPAHIRTAVCGVSLSIPVVGGRPALGTWQGVFLFEHRRAPQRRRIALHLIGA